MLYALDLLYVLVCLGIIVAGIGLLAHLRGTHAHAPDCRTCHRLHRLFCITDDEENH